MERVRQSTAAWALGLAACICNLLVLFLPFGIILGLVAVIVGAVNSFHVRGSGRAGIVLGCISLLIAVILAATVGSVFIIDPTL